MFRSTNKNKVAAVVVLTAMLFAAFGTMAAQAHRVPACDNSNGSAPEKNPHCNPLHDDDPGDPGDPGHDDDSCLIELLEAEVVELAEIELCLGVDLLDLDIDIDDLLHILHILHGVGSEVRLDWLHEHLSLGEKIDRLRGRIDLESVFEKLGWLEPGSLFTLLGFLGGGAGSATGLLDTDLLDGILDHDGGYEGGGDCGGLVNVCHNANGIVVNDVVDICTVTADNGSFNGPDDDGNADCDVIGDGILGLGDGFGLGQMGDVFGLVGLY